MELQDPNILVIHRDSDMNGAQGRSGTTPRSAMPAFGTFGQQQGSASLFLGKSNSSLRRSTPDSEAMASSDDEVEQSKVTAAPNFKKTGRRTSWLNDVSASNSNRKASFGNPYSPSTSHPSTPAAEQTSWNAMTSPSSTWGGANSSFPFNTIWQDNRKEPPTRLQEVLPSHGEQSIPFQIPLKPTPKTYRSQSYSVGQLDTTPAIPTSMPVSTSVEATRSRLGGQYPTLQRRTSRTSGLGDGSGLGRLREVDDNDEEGVTLDQEPETFVTSQARIEKLERENARLRHAAQARERTFSATSASQTQGLSFRNSRIHDSVPEESSPAIDDNDDMPPFVPYANQHNGVRRLSEQIAVHSQAQPLSPIENRPHENVKKAHWQSSLGFESIVEAPQSRRHSFADVPTRHGSFGSTGKSQLELSEKNSNTDPLDREGALDTFDSGTQETTRGEDRELALDSCHPTEAEMEKKYLLNRENAATYFHVTESRRREAEARVQQSYMTPNLYGQHSHMGAYLTPSSQPLFIVNFKCCRSDVFYIQDNTGLHVNVGDLVIVEADRGTDLGTVQHTNVTWDEARRYKDYYAEEHYKWLMMFSQQSRNGGPNVVNPNGLPNKQGSAVGGMGPQGHHGPHDVPHTELKPKMIKRLAQNHEIQALKDKEGNEAKAKRVCQQKVVEHRLNMEILDAEFQMYVIASS